MHTHIKASYDSQIYRTDGNTVLGYISKDNMCMELLVT